MADLIRNCPQCGQQLRFPKKIGGMLMACPACGKKFHSDFKLGGPRPARAAGLWQNIFGLPYEIGRRLYRYFTS